MEKLGSNAFISVGAFQSAVKRDLIRDVLPGRVGLWAILLDKFGAPAPPGIFLFFLIVILSCDSLHCYVSLFVAMCSGI